MKKLLILSLSAAALSACGGGGGGGTAQDAEVGGASGITSATAIARFSELNQGFINVSANTTLQTELPTTGTGTYAGNLGFDVRGALPGGGTDVDASMVGDMNVAVNFGGTNQPITGAVTNILYADTDGNFDNVGGQLNIVGGVTSLPRSGLPDLEGVISADADGDLTIDQSDGAGDKTVTFDLDLSGQFGGDSTPTSNETPLAMRGFVIGTGSGDLSLTIPNGRFAAETAGAGILP